MHVVISQDRLDGRSVTYADGGEHGRRFFFSFGSLRKSWLCAISPTLSSLEAGLGRGNSVSSEHVSCSSGLGRGRNMRDFQIQVYKGGKAKAGGSHEQISSTCDVAVICHAMDHFACQPRKKL